MRYDIKKELFEYFKEKKDRTRQENKFYMFLMNEIEFFDVVNVARDDVDDNGYDGQNMTDAQMEKLAEQMEIRYLDEDYGTHIKLIAQDMGIETIEEEE